MKLSALLGCLLALAVSAGCARNTIATTAQPTPAGEAGKILTMRPVPSGAAQEPLGAVLLTGGATESAGGSAEPLVEFIVRTDAGATLSIVQPNQAGLHSGDRVIVVHGDIARLAPAG